MKVIYNFRSQSWCRVIIVNEVQKQVLNIQSNIGGQTCG
ncbi:hypothetical protein M595_3139 [Lyngbya aestuarii BL J]|uniref:Uncharacterized protein n=1 Tax=Lyngbya aestuarii BL J TaxID=1348334 RepID=U7QFW7_9CYAN|nr:hypothetical protein M595_3139 [Lyngbya aestuarii BL J]